MCSVSIWTDGVDKNSVKREERKMGVKNKNSVKDFLRSYITSCNSAAGRLIHRLSLGVR